LDPVLIWTAVGALATTGGVVVAVAQGRRNKDKANPTGPAESAHTPAVNIVVHSHSPAPPPPNRQAEVTEERQPRPHPAPRERPKFEPICPSGPFPIGPGEYEPLQLDVADGDEVTGHIKELDGGNIAYWILDEENFTAHIDGRNFRAIRSGSRRVAHHINWRVVGDGPFHLVLDAPHARRRRHVEVVLRRKV